MNKIGRRAAQNRYAMTIASNEFLREHPEARTYVTESLTEHTSGRKPDGRWLAWVAVGPAIEEEAPQFDTATTMVMRRQPWVWRFIGRRRVDAALRRKAG